MAARFFFVKGTREIRVILYARFTLASHPQTRPGRAAAERFRDHHVTPKLLYAELTLVHKGHQVTSEAYRITGPQALSYPEVTEILSDATGKKLRYHNSLENYSRFLKGLGLDVNELLELDACVAKGADDGSAITNTIFELTGQQPIRFTQFDEDYSQCF